MKECPPLVAILCDRELLLKLGFKEARKGWWYDWRDGGLKPQGWLAARERTRQRYLKAQEAK